MIALNFLAKTFTGSLQKARRNLALSIFVLISLLISAGAAYAMITVPTEPLNVRSSAVSSSSVTIIWDEPTSDGGSPIINYQLHYYTDDNCQNLFFNINVGATKEFRVGALAAGQTISVDVSAQNNAGFGPVSACKAFTASPAPPTVPLNVRLDGGSSSSLTIIWDEPASDGGAAINGYQARYYSDNNCQNLVTGGNPGTFRQFSIGGLAPGQTISFDVSAQNVGGQGPRSDCETFTTSIPIPSLTSVTIASDNANSDKAALGNKVTLTLVSSVSLIAPPTVKIAGANATVTGGGTNWTGEITVDGSHPQGNVAIDVNGYSAGGLGGPRVLSTTDGSLVTIGRVPDAPTNLQSSYVLSPAKRLSPDPNAARYTEVSLNWTNNPLNGPTDTVLAPLNLWFDKAGACTNSRTGGSGLFLGTTSFAQLFLRTEYPEGTTVSLHMVANNDFGESAFSNCVTIVIPPLDLTAPTVTSVVRTTPATENTDADTLTWTVTFDEEVSLIDSTDFEFTGTTANASVTMQSATVYQVTASGGDLASLNSPVGLAFAAGQNIADVSGFNAINNTVPTGLNQTYQVINDETAPTIVSVTRGFPVGGGPQIPITTDEDIVSWFVQFSEDIAPPVASDFNVTGTTASVTVSHVTDSRYEISLSGGDLAELDGNVALFPAPGGHGIQDLAGNPLTDPNVSGANENFFIIVNDRVAPQLFSIGRVSASEKTNADQLNFQVNFTETVQNVDASDFSVIGPVGVTVTVTPVIGKAAKSPLSPKPSVSPFNAQPSGSALRAARPIANARSYEITLSGGNLAGLGGAGSGPVTVSLGLAPGQDIEDLFGNALTDLSPVFIIQNYIVSNASPALDQLQRIDATADALVGPVTNADTLAWRLTFSTLAGDFNLLPSAFTLSGVSGATLSVDRFSVGFNVTATGGDIADFNGDVTLGFAAGDPVDEFGNAFTDKTPSGANETTYTIDNVAPTVTASGAPALATGPFNVAFVFSEDVSGLLASDFSASNATTTLAGGPSQYTLTVTPNGNGPVTLSLPANAAADAGGNGNTALAAPIVVATDNTAPTVSISGAPAVVNGPFDLTVTFSEAVNGLTASDFGVTNATAQLTGGPAVYTLSVTPNNVGDISINLPANAAADDAGNGNTALAAPLAVTVDTTPPSVTATAPVATSNDPFDVTFTVSEDVTGLVAADFTVTNGTMILTGGPQIFIATVTPDGAGDISISLPADVATDAAGNGNEALQPNVSVEYDVTAPTAVATDPPAAVNGPFDLTFSFSEDMTGLEASDFIVANATVTLSGGPRDFILTITPDGTGDIKIELPANVATDPAGNGNAASSVDVEIVFDQSPPTLVITAPPNSQNEPFTTTFKFSEPVIGFEEDDVEVTNATLSGFKSLLGAQPAGEGGTQRAATASDEYSVQVTPTGEGEITISVKPGALGDVAGNLIVEDVQISISIDSTPPTVTIADLPDTVRGEFTVTVNFDEAVTGFGLSDVSLTNGAGSDFVSVSEQQYTLTVTPLKMGTVTVGIAANVATDASGNANTAAAPQSTEFIDEDFVRTRTSGIINNFMVRRADQITLSDPDLSRRLLENGTKGRVSGQADHNGANISMSAKASGERARLDKVIGADAAAKVNFWTEASLVSISADTADNDLLLVFGGVDYAVDDKTLVGVMGQYDFSEEKDQTEDFQISGDGWMVGPYVVHRVTDNLVVDGRAAVGQSSNEVSPFNSYVDKFDTNRWMLKGQVTGDFDVDDWTINPNLAVIYYSETQKAYADSYGIEIPDQDIALGRMTFGPRVSKTFSTKGKTTVSPHFGVKGIWDFEKAQVRNLTSGRSSDTDTLRARAEGGINIGFSNGNRLSLDGFYDGVGASDYEAYGVKSTLSLAFR